MAVIVFDDTPSGKCGVYSVSKGKLKILGMSWEQDRCRNESTSERKRERGGEGESEKDKNRRYASAGNTDERRPRLARVCDKQEGKKNKLTNNAVDFAQTDNTLNASFTHLLCFPPSLY